MTNDETSPRPAVGPPAHLEFPADFQWGAATAAYQVEGSADRDGRGPSIWDTFSHTPGKVVGGDTGDVAADHYNRYRDDVALMAGLGLTAYRFSVSWPRVQPGGVGPANQRGLDFYRRLIDELLGAGIQPWLTLYHWDLPQPLEDTGGWPARDTAYRFADYVELVAAALGDRVRYWTTVNEPWCSAFLGYGSGEHAPGRSAPTDALYAAHHLLLAHGLAVERVRSAAPDAQCGISPNFYPVSPNTDADEDRDAARRIDGLQNRLFLDPLLRGRYPDDVLADIAPYVEPRGGFDDEDLKTIATPLDMLGVNYYNRYSVSGQPGPITQPPSRWPGSEHVRFVRQGLPSTGMDWEIDEYGLFEMLYRIHRDYPGALLYVTENGAAFDDRVAGDGAVRDSARIAFLDAHLRACHAAIRASVPLRGYFTWSLMDNFEWGQGYSKRFGLVYLDYPTQRRIPKDSARWYASVIRRRGLLPAAQ